MTTRKYTWYFQVYQLLLHNIFTRSLVLNVRKRFELLCPASESYTVKKTVQTLLITWGLLFLEILGIILLNPGILQMMIAIMIAIVLHKEIIQLSVHRMEEKILLQLEQFITDVRHHYYVSHMIDDAILDATDQMSYEMRIHAMKIYDIITSDHCEELADQYHLTSHNNYLNLFLALCVTVVEYGDRKVNDQSLFLLNLSNLKSEVNIGRLKLSQMNYLYSGLTFVTLAPMTLLKVIESWGIANLPELGSFYHNIIGYVTSFLTILISFIIYTIVCDLKNYQMFLPKNYILLDSILDHNFTCEMISNYINTEHPSIKKMKNLIDESGETISLEQVFLMKFLYGFAGMIGCTVVSICSLLKDHGRYDWYELFLAVVVSMVCFHIPDWRLIFHKKIAYLGREDEIISYQSIVLMLMYIERVSVLEILERIEEFSQIFRKQIQNCINNYNLSDCLALTEFKDSTNFIPLQRFIDNLIISDEIGIEKAFDEVASDRVYFQEKRKQENAMTLNKRSELAKFLAYIPAVLVIGGYLILPFLIECYHQLSVYQEMMGSFLS